MMAMAGVLPASAATAATAATTSAALRQRLQPGIETTDAANAFRFMPAARSGKNSIGQLPDAATHAKAASMRPAVSTAKIGEISPISLPAADMTGYLDAPDGSSYFYTMDYDKESIEHEYFTETIIKGYKIDIYDRDFQLIGSIEDTITLGENETKVAQVEIATLVTKKFFNNDNNIEVMVAIACNTPEFTNTYHTAAYSVKPGETTTERIAEIEGYYVSSVNTAPDQWAEQYYITFLTEKETETPMVGAVQNVADFNFTTYKFAGYGGMGNAVLDVRVPMIAVSGENAIPFISTTNDGRPYFAVNRMKYCWFENPYDYENENPTADNELIIDIYTMPSQWSSAVEKYSTTTVPSKATADDRYFLYLGTFSYKDDLSFGRYTTDNHPSLIITTEHYLYETDDYDYDFDVCSAAPKGETAETEFLINLASHTMRGTVMADIDGFDPQVMFISSDNDEYRYDFVNLITGETEHSIPTRLENGLYFTTAAERVELGDGYCYAAAQTNGKTDADGNVYTEVAYVNPDASIHHVDRLNMGKNVDYAMVYIAYDAFSPYIFNLDDSREYMVLVKRREDANSSRNHEELMVISADESKAPLLQLLPDEERGALSTVYFANLDSEKPSLVAIYNKDSRFTLTSYNLPFSTFEEGDGSLDNPYQITSLGGFGYIRHEPSAHYVLANDIDADGATLEQPSFDFRGTFDGRGHSIYGLRINGRSIFPTISTQEGSADGMASVSNLNLIRPTMTAAESNQGIVAGKVYNGRLANIHIFDGTLAGTESTGGIAGALYQQSHIEASSFNGAISSDGSAGGIVGFTSTASSIKACAFSGSISGSADVGGIAGSLQSNSDLAADCHVKADITAGNTVGGIAGSSNHASIRNCHAEGTIAATQASKWGGGPKLGGIVGDLSPFTALEADDAPEPNIAIENCYVNFSSMTDSTTPGEETFPGENDTFHRIAGRTAINHEQDPENPIGEEEGMRGNYVSSAIQKVSESISDADNTSEGKSIDPLQADREFFTSLGFAYGYDSAEPWSMTGSETAPALWFEGGFLAITPAKGTVNIDEETVLSLELIGEEITEEMLGGLTLDFDNEEIAEITAMELADNHHIAVTVRGLKEGSAVITAGLNGKTAKAELTVSKPSGVEETEIGVPGISISGRMISAPCAEIEVFDTLGRRIARGHDSLTLPEPPGVCIIRATGSDGNAKVIKRIIR